MLGLIYAVKSFICTQLPLTTGEYCNNHWLSTIENLFWPLISQARYDWGEKSELNMGEITYQVFDDTHKNQVLSSAQKWSLLSIHVYQNAVGQSGHHPEFQGTTTKGFELSGSIKSCIKLSVYTGTWDVKVDQL